MKSAFALTVRSVSRTILASSIASFLLAGIARGVDWPGDLPPGGILTLDGIIGGDDVNLMSDTTVTLDGAGSTLQENIIANLGTGAVTTLTVNNAAGHLRTLAAIAMALGGADSKTLVVAGSADLRIGRVSDGGFANMNLEKNGGAGELILYYLSDPEDPLGPGNDLDGATLRVVNGTVSIEGGGGTASPISALVNAIQMNGTSAKLRLGTLSASGTTFNNNLAVNDSGTLEHTAASNDTLSGLVTLASGKTLTANVTDGSLLLSGSFSRGASSNLTKIGAGTLILSGFGSGTGLTTVNGGTLQFGMPGSLYNNTPASWTPANIIVNAGATLAVNVGGASDFTTGNVATLLTALSAVNNNGLKAGATFGFDTTNATATVPYATAITNSSGTGGGAVGLTKLGTGTLSLSVVNTYSGVTTIKGGTLQFAKPGSLYNNTPASWTPANIIVNAGATLAVNVGGGTDFSTANVSTLLSQISTVAGNGLKAGSTFGFDTTNAVGAVPYASPITNSAGAGGGAVGITKLGAGTLSLDSMNTYSGATTISAGTLALGSGGSINSSSGVSIAAGATYSVSEVAGYTLMQTLSAKGTGTANVTGAMNVGAQTVSLQDGANIGTLAFNSTLSLSGATLRFDLSATNSDRITIGGTVSMGGTNIIDVARLASATGLATGSQAYTLITAGGGLASSGFSLSNSLITIGATAYTLSLSGDATHQYLGVTSGSTAVPTTHTLATSASAHSIRAGTGTSMITTTITNTGTTGAGSDSLSYTSLGSTVAPGVGVTLGSPAPGGTVAPNAGGTAQATASQSFSSTVAGSYLLTASGGTVTNTTLGGSPGLQGAAGTDTINVYRLAAPGAIGTPLTFSGNHHVGDVVPTQTLSLTNTAVADGFSEKLDAAFSDSTGGALGSGSIALLAPGDSDTTSLVVGLDTGSVGAKSGTVTVGLTSNGAGTSLLGPTGLTAQVITVNAGSVFRLAAASEISPLVDLGRVHANGSFGTVALSISNEAEAGAFTEGLNASFSAASGAATHNSGTIGNLAGGSSNSTSLVVGLGGAASTGTAGAVSGTATVALVSNGMNSGLSNTSLTSQDITVSGFVYSGLGAWNLDGGGDWAAIGNWQANGGVPGLDAGFTATDTATFGSSATTTNPTVSLNGVSPNLKALTFNNASQSYTLGNAAGGTLKLDNGAGIATVTGSNGSHTIGVPVELDSDTTVNVANSGDLLALSGGITQSGTRGLTKTGSGTLSLSGAQTYGTLTASAGTTNVDAAIGSGSSSVTVNNPGTSLKFGSVSQTLASLTIGAGATVTFTSGPAAFSGSGKAVGSGGDVVPEPGTLGLLLVGALGMLGRRRRA